ncbi:hypothetical protein BD324DRAFT_577737, partial [Kockovaella imperatae]
EVERTRKLIEAACRGYRITKMKTVEDKLVYSGVTHQEFVYEVTGRTITGCRRKGKIFWLTLTGEGRLPVMHFGMNGMVMLKGETPSWYVRRPKERRNIWPPKYNKFIMELEPQQGSVSDEPRELAFTDSRRLGRLRLVPQPVEQHPPVSKLGFDPVLSYPTIEEFRELLKKKRGTVKGMIMDQSFSAGVGNWVADEILYQARLHPACPVPSLNDDQIESLHRQIREVPQKAVDVNAEHKKFPEDWLFRWRWKKGAKQANGKKKAIAIQEALDSDEDPVDIVPKNRTFLALPDGKPATLDFIEIGGRTTALVRELQKMPEGVDIKPKIPRPRKDREGSVCRDPASIERLADMSCLGRQCADFSVIKYRGNATCAEEGGCRYRGEEIGDTETQGECTIRSSKTLLDSLPAEQDHNLSQRRADHQTEKR